MDTLFTGSTIIKLDAVPSTNTYAMQALKAGNLTEGTVIVARHQTEGRGQFGNTWEAEEGKNLTFSLVMHPVFLRADKQFYLSKIAALAVLGVLTEFLPSSQYDIHIKWPNDLLVNEQKIAGILIENVIDASGLLQYSVIGVGLNVNQLAFGATKRKATSLAVLLEKEIDKGVLLERFCKHFEALYLSLKRGAEERIDKQYLLNLFRYEQTAAYRVGENEMNGKIVGVEHSGKLILQRGDGELLRFNFKEIEFL